LFNIKPIAIPVKRLTVPMSRSLPVVVVKKTLFSTCATYSTQTNSSALSFNAWPLIYIPQDLTFENFAWCSHSDFVFYTGLRTKSNFYITVTKSRFITEVEYFDCALHPNSLYNILHFGLKR